MAQFPLEIRSLVKHYGSVLAVDDVSFSVQPGEIFGLLGPNGAGKTSIISILTTLERPSSGEAFVFGHQVRPEHRRTKAYLGIVPQEIVSHGFFTVEEVLHFHSGYYGIRNNQKHIDYLLERLGLSQHREKRVRQLSGGMKRRFLIAKALVHEPRLLLLDEPTAGVDVELRSSLWSFVRELNKQKELSILLTTHYLEEAEELCDRVAFLHQGKLLREGETKKLISQLTTREVTLCFTEPLSSLTHPRLIRRQNNEAVFHLPHDVGVGQVLNELQIAPAQLKDVRIHEGSLEDAFRSVIWEKIHG